MVFWFLVLAIVLAIAVWGIKWIRDNLLGDSPVSSSDHLSSFRELRDQGILDDDEFRRVRSTVGLKETFPEADKNNDQVETTEPVKFEELEKENND